MRVVYPPVTYDLMLALDQERIDNLNFICNTNDIKSILMPRMKISPFYELLKRFREKALLDSIHTCVEEQIATRLHVVSHN
jgi:hypothetical protein